MRRPLARLLPSSHDAAEEGTVALLFGATFRRVVDVRNAPIVSGLEPDVCLVRNGIADGAVRRLRIHNHPVRDDCGIATRGHLYLDGDAQPRRTDKTTKAFSTNTDCASSRCLAGLTPTNQTSKGHMKS